MKRLNIELSEDQYRFLIEKAKREGKPLVQIIRVAIETLRKKSPKAYSYKSDSLYLMDASFESENGDLAVNHDKYLYGKK